MASQYIEALQTAVLFFPFVALLFTLPYAMGQYHKYGSVLVLRTVVVYSFILYLMCTAFLIVLPLPSMEKVAKLTTPYYQLIPFRELGELFSNPQVVWSEPSTYLHFFLNRNFFQIAANVLMTVPFGIYLRYYFGADLKKTLWFTFGLSLIFELTQLSGLFFIYPRPYRLADVDDLITNTLGGLIGYWIAPLLMKVLPSRERMDTVAFRRSSRVSVMRRMFAAFVDCFLLMIAATCVLSMIPGAVYANSGKRQLLLILFGVYSGLVLLYFGVGEWLWKGRTPGKLLMKIRLVDSRTMRRPKLWQCIVRYGIFYLVVLPSPVMALVMLWIDTESHQYAVLSIIACMVLMLVFISFCVGVVIASFEKGMRLPHGWLSKTQDVSTLVKPKARGGWYGRKHGQVQETKKEAAAPAEMQNG